MDQGDRRYLGTNIEHCLDISGVELRGCGAERGEEKYFITGGLIELP